MPARRALRPRDNRNVHEISWLRPRPAGATPDSCCRSCTSINADRHLRGTSRHGSPLHPRRITSCSELSRTTGRLSCSPMYTHKKLPSILRTHSSGVSATGTNGQYWGAPPPAAAPMSAPPPPLPMFPLPGATSTRDRQKPPKAHSPFRRLSRRVKLQSVLERTNTIATLPPLPKPRRVTIRWIHPC